ncbi:MAG: type II toxin-antitoxin system VapC family toxin [Candidatus Binataceae bacterium]
MRRIFVDTSGFYALIVGKDDNHGRADELFGLAQREAWRLVTTNAVVFETHALLLHRSRPGRETALKFLDAVQADTYDVVRVRKNDEEKAIALIRAHEDKLYSLCDALSFVVMERLRIHEAIAFDQDFRTYGKFALL